MTKRIAVLGSTGSIGQQTLEVIESLGSAYKVVALTAGANDRLLSEQIGRFRPEMACLYQEAAAESLAGLLKGSSCRIYSGSDGQIAAATWPSADLVVMAQVGFSGFEPLVAALRGKKRVALANKESLVVGGEILDRMGLLDRQMIIPVDSEHSAIFQAMGSAPLSRIRRIYLTASGGPFFGLDKSALDKVSPAEALKHPNWQMGAKITIDSATMMNKGLEVIEGMWLFGLPLEKIEVVIHRQSIVHSMVEYVDGSVLAQLGAPDMRLPIQYALTYPDREESSFDKFNPYDYALSFEPPDRDNFPCLDLAYRAAGAGGTMPAVLNGANEYAVKLFLEGKLAFTGIPALIEKVMLSHKVIEEPGVDDVIEADRWSRLKAKELLS